MSPRLADLADNRIDPWSHDEQAIRLGSPLLVDTYHITQLAFFFEQGLHKSEGIHDFFARVPILGSYLFVAGLSRTLKQIRNFHFNEEELFQVETRFPEIADNAFLSFLEDFRFRGDIWAVPQGQLVFGQNEPILKVIGNLLEGWYLETMIMAEMNSALADATNATHFVHAAGDLPVVDFGLRRAKSDGAKILGAENVLMGGVVATSNVAAGIALDAPLSGTMSHENIQIGTSYRGGEKNAFKEYIRFAVKRNLKLILLIDTYNSVRGAKNAIIAMQELSEELGVHIKAEAVRIDSGDLYEQAVKVRALDPEREWFDYIFPTNNLDPLKIADIIEKDKQTGLIRGFGAGTNLLNPPEVVGGVYKLSAQKHDGKWWQPSLKMSDDVDKTTLPGNKQLWRCLDERGMYVKDVLCLGSDPVPEGDFFPLLEPVMREGHILIDHESIDTVRRRGLENLGRLPEKYRAYKSREVFPVRLSPGLIDMREKFIAHMEEQFAAEVRDDHQTQCRRG
jgi:nicotinate phosphoribosyltransferase